MIRGVVLPSLQENLNQFYMQPSISQAKGLYPFGPCVYEVGIQHVNNKVLHVPDPDYDVSMLLLNLNL